MLAFWQYNVTRFYCCRDHLAVSGPSYIRTRGVRGPRGLHSTGPAATKIKLDPSLDVAAA